MTFSGLGDWLKDNTAIAALGAVVLLFIRPMVERGLRGRTAWAAMNAELVDLERHLKANAGRLDEMLQIMDCGARVPQRNHILKLGITEHLMLLNDDALENLSATKIAAVHRARIRLRNFNIDVAEAVRQHDAAEFDQLETMIIYLAEVNLRLRTWAPNMLKAKDQALAGLKIVAEPRQAKPTK